MKKTKIALLGFGGIARSHFAAIEALEKEGAPIELVAICDSNVKQFTSSVAINSTHIEISIPPHVKLYASDNELLEKQEFDVVDICLPTFLHKTFAVQFLRAGKHVLCEKPMALSFAECEEMLLAAKESGKQLMIGHCLRFAPTYLYLKELIDQGIYGELSSLRMKRLSVMPTWSAGNWLQAEEKSGGMLLDMHIHDIDMARYLLGDPLAVSTVTCNHVPHFHTESTRLFYKNATVDAIASQQTHPTCPFLVGYEARFEHATVRMERDAIEVFPDDAPPFTPLLPQKDMIAEELRYFADLVANDLPNLENPPVDTAKTVRLIELLKKSSQNGGERMAVV